jgi:hypothetical protein
MRYVFDALAEINNSFLFVFAAGNLGRIFSVNLRLSISQAPTFSGIVKPDVVAPGTDIGSAGSNNTFCTRSNRLHLRSGMSIAPLATSGSLALVLQSLTEWWHQLPTNATITLALLRAFAILQPGLRH